MDRREPHSSLERPPTRSATGLVGDAMDHASNMVRGEIDLLRAELQENLSRAVRAMGLIVGAVVVILVALNVLAAAATAGIAQTGLGPGWAALIVGGVLLLVGILMVLKGKKDLSAVSLAPTRTARNVREDATAVREATDV